MTRDEIIRMAEKAGFERLAPHVEDWVAFTEEIERFANLVAAAQREKDAAICEGCANTEANGATLAEFIRAQGESK